MSSEINETFITQQEVSNFMIIRQLIRHLQAKGLTVEGLFSTPVVDAEVQQVKHKIKQEREGVDLVNISKSPYVIAEILLEYLSPPYLLQPLLTYSLYDALVLLVQFHDRDVRLQYMALLLDGLHPVYKSTVKQLVLLLQNIANNAAINKTPLDKLIPIFAPIFLRPRKMMSYMQQDEPLVAKVLSELILEHERLLPNEDLSKATTTSPRKNDSLSPSVSLLSSQSTVSERDATHSLNAAFENDVIQLHNSALFDAIKRKTTKFYSIDEILAEEHKNMRNNENRTTNMSNGDVTPQSENLEENVSGGEAPQLLLQQSTSRQNDVEQIANPSEETKRESEGTQNISISSVNLHNENVKHTSTDSPKEETEIIVDENDDETVVVHSTEDTNLTVPHSNQTMTSIASSSSPPSLGPLSGSHYHQQWQHSPSSKEEMLTHSNESTDDSIQPSTHDISLNQQKDLSSSRESAIQQSLHSTSLSVEVNPSLSQSVPKIDEDTPKQPL